MNFFDHMPEPSHGNKIQVEKGNVHEEDTGGVIYAL